MLLKWLGKRDSDFSRNIKSAIDRAGLVENVDYQVIKSAQQGCGAEIKDYVFHPDSAKDIAMMDSSEKGHDSATG